MKTIEYKVSDEFMEQLSHVDRWTVCRLCRESSEIGDHLKYGYGIYGAYVKDGKLFLEIGESCD